MARRKGSVTSVEHRLRIAEAQRRRHAKRDKTAHVCPTCGRTYRGEHGLAVHLGMAHPEGVRTANEGVPEEKD